MPQASDDSDAELWDALDSVRKSIEQIEGCTPTERDALVTELQGLKDLAKKLRNGRVEIVVFGEISTGKSAMINALTGQEVAQVNVRGGWTKDVWNLSWEGAGYSLPGFDHSEVVLIDTPGLNEVDGEERAVMAREAAERADLILFVIDSDLNETEHNALEELAASHKPILLVVNKIDLYTPAQLTELTDVLQDRSEGLVEPSNVVFTAADPREVQYIIESADGSTREEWRKPPAKVDDLRTRILEVLEADGKALIALSASMYAADRSDRVASLRVKMRSDKATATIWSFAVTKALAVSLNPAPALDVVGGIGVDAAMVMTLGSIYGIKMTQQNARDLVTSVLKAAGLVLVSEAVVSYASSLFKGLTFGASTAITAVPQAAAAGFGSYIVGQAARYYFEHGASWGDRGPKSVIASILKNTDKSSVLSNLKAEIRSKLESNRHSGEKK